MISRKLFVAILGTPVRHACMALATLATIAVLVPSQAEAASRYAALVVDGHTGKVLYSRNADGPRYPASLTKIMTLYMLFEFLDAGKVGMQTRFVVTPFAAGQSPSKVGLKAGETIRVIDAIRALVTKSANDVAVVVAENLGGTESNFARLMTAKARQIGMSRTTFRNASGLPNSEQITTARDMVTLGQRIQSDFPKYYGFFKTKYFTFRGKRYRNHNSLLFHYRGIDGIKTGYTRASGFNLVASVRRGEKHLIAVVMGGKTGKARNAHMASLLTKSMPRAIARSRIKTVPLPTRNPETLLASSRRYQVASLTSAISAPKPRVAGSKPTPMRLSAPSGTHHVQVGAYTSRQDARDRIAEVRSAAAGLLDGREPLTMKFRKRKTTLYRARFAGFTKDGAREACDALKHRKINCVVMRAE